MPSYNRKSTQQQQQQQQEQQPTPAPYAGRVKAVQSYLDMEGDWQVVPEGWTREQPASALAIAICLDVGYGDAQANAERIAEMWNAALDAGEVRA